MSELGCPRGWLTGSEEAGAGEQWRWFPSAANGLSLASGDSLPRNISTIGPERCGRELDDSSDPQVGASSLVPSADHIKRFLAGYDAPDLLDSQFADEVEELCRVSGHMRGDQTIGCHP